MPAFRMNRPNGTAIINAAACVPFSNFREAAGRRVYSSPLRVFGLFYIARVTSFGQKARSGTQMYPSGKWTKRCGCDLREPEPKRPRRGQEKLFSETVSRLICTRFSIISPEGISDQFYGRRLKRAQPALQEAPGNRGIQSWQVPSTFSEISTHALRRSCQEGILIVKGNELQHATG